MQPTINLTISVQANAQAMRQAAANLTVLADQFENVGGMDKAEATDTETTASRPRTRKAAKTEPEEFDLGEGDAEETAAPATTLDEVRQSLQAHAKKYSRESAGKILKKMGVKGVGELKPEQYAKVVELASA